MVCVNTSSLGPLNKTVPLRTFCPLAPLYFLGGNSWFIIFLCRKGMSFGHYGPAAPRPALGHGPGSLGVVDGMQIQLQLLPPLLPLAQQLWARFLQSSTLTLREDAN